MNAEVQRGELKECAERGKFHIKYTWLTEGPRKVEPQEAIVLNHIILKFMYEILERGKYFDTT